MYMGKIGQKSAAFINHKPFHPGSVKNLEKVWIAEQKHAEQQKRQQEFLEKRTEESKIEELRRALRKSTKPEFEREHDEHMNRLGWMYNHAGDDQRTGLGAGWEKADGTPDQGEYLPADNNLSTADKSFLKIITDKEDLMRRLKEDPMYAVKQAEAQYARALKTNPLLRKREEDVELRYQEKLRRAEEREERRRLREVRKQGKKTRIE